MAKNSKTTSTKPAASTLKVDVKVKKSAPVMELDIVMPRKGTLLAQAVARLSRKNNTGMTPAEIQEATGMSRRFSMWDMKRMAEQYGKKLVTGANKFGYRTYRFE